ncbi:hypothetical protein I79_006089 [Cricetulus griseus]|uniref:Uncharacterized protein n=1 Tax=Cricetulus griseus TaxID=10029 RepID=G3H6W9_CRIGR|nr:hypothetical protein I79_006089 [Cricetulus griseus]
MAESTNTAALHQGLECNEEKPLLQRWHWPCGGTARPPVGQRRTLHPACVTLLEILF